jgi:hypothetical protein
MAANPAPIGEALEGFHSSHLHPSGCRGAHTGLRTEILAERSR